MLKAGSLLRLCLAFALALLVVLAGLTIAPDLRAQTAPQATPQAPAKPAVQAVPSAFAEQLAKLDTIGNDLSRIETALRTRNPLEAELTRLREQVEPTTDPLRGLIEELTPRVEQARLRLEQLGPRAENEGADVAAERALRERSLAQADETVRIARAQLVQSEQIKTEINDRRRRLFARALFERSPSVIGLELWSSVAKSLPADLRAARLFISDAGSALVDRLTVARLVLIALGLAAAAALYAFRSRALVAVARRLGELDGSSSFRRILIAWITLAAAVIPAVMASFLLSAAINASDILPNRVESVISALLFAIAHVITVRALADALVAPDARRRRILSVWDSTAASVVSLAVGCATVLAVGKVVEAFLQAIAAGLSLSIAAKTLLALAFAVALLMGLRRLRDRGEAHDQSAEAIPGAIDGNRLGPIRILGWIAAAVIVGAALSGYAAFASFLSDQVLWALVLLSIMVLLLLLIDEGMREGFERDSKLAQTLRANIGLSQRTIQQIGVLGGGFAKLVAGFVGVLLLLAPLGVESTDLVSSLKAAFFGFRVGDVTVSLSSVIIGCVLFAIGIVATRSLQSWLEDRFLPSTELDTGLRNSIRTGIGYIGFVAALALAISAMGLSLDRLAIVAGALSVGIGFGLQSIVNNFVSGLILLWERSIRVGDWIVVGADQGHVRRISVRATEIETFDRSLVILPNSSLISGVVKNRVRTDRTGRIVLPISVRYTADPARTQELIEFCARAHAGVLATPPPKAYLLRIAEQKLEFELRCFVPDVEKLMATSSDLHFAIFAALTADSIEIA